MMAAVIGIDPGIGGAFARLEKDGRLWIEDMPTVDVGSQKRSRREVDPAGVAALLREMTSDGRVAMLAVERQQAMPGQGLTSAFGLGRSLGVIVGVAAGLGLPVTMLQPAAWKRELGVPAVKNGARARASELMPQGVALWLRTRDHGRAEAALLAWLCMSRLRARRPA